MRSLTIEGCVEKGRDYREGGPLYNHGQILAHGVPDSIDSIAAIKKFVYDEKKYTLTEVRDALAANYEGYDEMYDTFRNSGLNFGNDIE
jgi:formate C-acetyltransferase